MKQIPMLEKFAAESLVEQDGELIFSKEKFAELIVQECANRLMQDDFGSNKGIMRIAGAKLKEHFGVEE